MSFMRSLYSLIFAVPLVCSVPALAQEATPQDDPESASSIEVELEEAIVPLSNALGFMLRTALPEPHGRSFPLGMSIEAPDPYESIEIVYTCIWGREICEPFFQACVSLLLDCSDGGFPHGP